MTKLFHLLLSFLILSPFSQEAHKKSQLQTLSPTTELEQTKRLSFSFTPEWADSKRETIDPNIFQGYDVRGIALAHGTDKVNLRIVDAFLIAEAIAYTYMNAFHKALGEGKIDGHRNRNATPRILITGDARETSQTLIAAAAKGAALQGFEVDYDAGHVPTGAANFYALLKDYDAVIQVTGGPTPYWRNGLKTAIRQNEKGFFDPNGKLTPLYGHQGERPFELKTIYETITKQAKEIQASRNRTLVIQDIAGSPLYFEDSYLERFVKLPSYGTIVQEYVTTLKEQFKKLKTSRRFVVDCGNGIGSAVIPVLEYQGHIIEEGIYLEVSRPDHPADPSKDMTGKKPIAESGCRACIERVKKRNATLSKDEPPLIGILTSGDGNQSALIDEEGNVIPQSAMATLIYRRFILENKETLEKLNQLGYSITFADPHSHRQEQVDKEIQKLIDFKKTVRMSKLTAEEKIKLNNTITDKLIPSFVLAETSVEDGFFAPLRVLEILDTWNDFEAKELSITAPQKNVYLLKDIFPREQIPTLPSVEEMVDPQLEISL